jgi:HK97 family phage major capsid protein
MQRQLDAIDLSLKDRIPQFTAPESLVEKLKANPQFAQLLSDRRGKAVQRLEGKDAASLLQRKTTITSSGEGYMTTGVLPIDRTPGITPEPRQRLQLRNLLYASATTMAVVDFIRVQTPMSNASPVPESSAKPENQLHFTALSEKIRTLATWIPASKQVLDDLAELASFINGSLSYAVNNEEELQLLSGDGTGENLHGLIPQAAVFNPAGLPSGYTFLDVVAAAIASIEVAKELPPTFCVLHPSDWWHMKMLKDTLGRYLLGDPSSVAPPRLFDLDVISTVNIAKGSFLIGSGSPTASEIRDRMELTIEVSTEHMDFFIKNLVAIRGEKRLALLVKRPNSYVTGSFSGAAAASEAVKPGHPK